MTLFEVFLMPGASGEGLLSDEVQQESGAQLFTPEEAKMVGLEGVPDDPEGRPRVLIACGDADERLIHTRLEANATVASFKRHVL